MLILICFFWIASLLLLYVRAGRNDDKQSESLRCIATLLRAMRSCRLRWAIGIGGQNDRKTQKNKICELICRTPSTCCSLMINDDDFNKAI